MVTECAKQKNGGKCRKTYNTPEGGRLRLAALFAGIS